METYEMTKNAILENIHTYEMTKNAILERFSDAKFEIWCFETVDEIENKVLNYDSDNIIITDKRFYDPNRSDVTQDFYIVTRKPNKKHIYYCDVIDELIKNKFCRYDCKYRYLQSILLCPLLKNNVNSTPIYCFFWAG